MTPIGGETDAELTRLVVVDPTPPPRPVDVTPAVHRMRAASFDAQWHAWLDGVFYRPAAS